MDRVIPGGGKTTALEPSPEAPGFDPRKLERAKEVLVRHVSGKTTPGAVGLVLHAGAVAAKWAVGRHRYEPGAPEVRPEDVYDLASLTKVVATSAICMHLEASGRLDLDEPVAERMKAFRGAGREKVTPRLLLAHCSGLPAHAELYRTCLSAEAVQDAVCRIPLACEPGTQDIYSDPGFILLGALLERVSGQRPDRLARQYVLDPLGMAGTTYRPGRKLHPRIPPTEYDADVRERLIHGEVHDENAWAMGGVAPHAGLFGHAEDLGRFLHPFLNGGRMGGRQVFPKDRVHAYTARANLVPGSTRSLGWDTVSGERSTTGTHFSPESFGSLGFTGTSIWADPKRDLGVVLLTNRIHPNRKNRGIRRLRPEFHDAISEALVT